jgi:hypothetical protein
VEDAEELLDDILSLASAPSLPTPNSKKTQILSTLVIMNQRLPWIVLRGHVPRIVSLFEHVLSADGDDRMRAECFKVWAPSVVNAMF